MTKDKVLNYGYDMRRTIMPKWIGDTVSIRVSWVERLKEYTTQEGYNLGKIIKFIQKGLTDPGVEKFATDCLKDSLSPAQEWVLLNIYLGSEVPELLRKKGEDEKAPEMLELPESFLNEKFDPLKMMEKMNPLAFMPRTKMFGSNSTESEQETPSEIEEGDEIDS